MLGIVDHESDDYTNYKWCCWYSHQKISTMTGGVGNNRIGGDCPNYIIVEISQDTAKKSPGDLKRLAGFQTPAKNYQLMLMLKTQREKNNNNNTVMLIVVGALGTSLKCLKKRLKGQRKNQESYRPQHCSDQLAYQKSPGDLRKCAFRFQWKITS